MRYNILVSILNWLEISLLLILFLKCWCWPSEVPKLIIYIKNDYLAVLLDGSALVTKMNNYVSFITQVLKIVLHANIDRAVIKIQNINQRTKCCLE